VVGPSILGWFAHEAIADLTPVIDFALGLMAVAVGNQLRFRRLRNAKKRLGILVLLESLLTPALVFVLAHWLGGAPWSLAILFATISISTAPATVLALVKEAHARGPFVKTLLAGVALNNLACITLFELARSVTRSELAPEGHSSFAEALLAPLQQLAIAALLGGVVGAVLVVATRKIVRRDRLSAISLVAILLVVGLSEAYGISTLLSCLFLGITLANLTPAKEEIGHAVFANFETAIFAVFFTVAGMELRLDAVPAGGLLALLVCGGRMAGKYLAGSLAMRLGGATERVRKNLGPALVPQAGLAVGLMLLITEDATFAASHNTILAVVLTVVLINEIAGPILARRAIERSGECGMDKPHTLDFLHEEDILTDFRAATKEDAIRLLVAHLAKTHRLAIEPEALLERFFERERSQSTCLGEGLAIPHCRVPEGDHMLGVMGICREGLRFATPDHRPVHCMVLLVSPEGQEDHHLEVLAALARVIGSDRNVRDELFHAKTPAHAYELLHAEEEQEDFEDYLDREDDEA
jgi:fructose PTS system EIIBC or EIIC component